MKLVIAFKIVPPSSKIVKHKLNGSNYYNYYDYYEWSNTIRFYQQGTKIHDYIDQDTPKDNTKKAWVCDDAILYIQIKNSLEGELDGLVNHCDIMKEKFVFLEFLYS